MTRVLRAFLATVLAVLLAVPVMAQPADDDRAKLLDLRRATQEELADIGRQLDEIQVRKVKEDWVIVRALDGEYVQVNLEQIDKLVPWVQMALADQDAAPVLLRALARHQPELVKAAEATESASTLGKFLSVASNIMAGDELDAYRKLKAGDIEGVDSDVIREFIRDFFAGASEQQRKADRYAAFEAQLNEQRETLEMLLAVLDTALDKGDVVPPDEPSECTESDMWCDDGDSEIEYDAHKGLTQCDDGDETCDDEVGPADEADATDDETDDGDGNSLAGCWKGNFGSATAWVHLTWHEQGDVFNGRFVTRWQHAGDSGPSYAIDWVDGDLRSGWPSGTFYGTGPFDDWYTCEEPLRGHDDWATFHYWEVDDRPWFDPCDDSYITLTDQYGSDQSDPQFGMSRAADEVCNEAYANANEYLSGRDE